MAVIVAIAAVAVALRPEKVKQPTLPGWPAVGSRAGDSTLRETAWRAWARRDPSVALERTAMLFADDWREGQRTVVLLAVPHQLDVQIAVVLVNDQQAERYSTRRVPADVPFITEVVEANGRSAVVALAPGMSRATLTTAAVGARQANEVETKAVGGLLLPVPADQYATRIVLKSEGIVLADRIPGADLEPQMPPAPLIDSASIDRGGQRVQIRSDGNKVRCEVTLADKGTDALTLVECPPSSQ